MPFLTPGLQRLWEIVAGGTDDSLVGGTVSIGGESVLIVAENVEIVTDDQRVGCRIEATLASDQANAEWNHVEVTTRGGVVVYEDDEDRGRKAAGSEWVLELNLWLTGA